MIFSCRLLEGMQRECRTTTDGDSYFQLYGDRVGEGGARVEVRGGVGRATPSVCWSVKLRSAMALGDGKPALAWRREIDDA